MAVRTKSLAAVTATTTLTTAYTVPAGETTILRSMVAGKFATGAVVLTVTVLRGATAYGLWRFAFGIGAAVEPWEHWVALAPGDVVRTQTDVGQCSVFFSGAELEGVAD